MSKPAEEVLYNFLESIDTMELKEGESLKLKNSLKVAYDNLQKDKNVEVFRRIKFENFKIKFHNTSVESNCNEILEIKEYTIYRNVDKENEIQYLYNGVFDYIEVKKFKRMIKTIMTLTSCMCLEVSAYGINKTILFKDTMKALRMERKFLDEVLLDDYDSEDDSQDYDDENFYTVISNKIFSLIVNYSNYSF